MLQNLLIHPLTKKQLEVYLNRPTQTLLLSGAIAAGKKTLARAIAAEFLNVNPVNIDSHAFYTEIKKPEDKRTIGIEQVRVMQRNLSLSTIGRKKVRRVIVIADADQLNSESQNTLLKTLEEPPDFTVFILTSSRPKQLLPTIQSRLPNMTVHSIPLQQAQEFMASDSIAGAWSLSGGSAGLLHALVQGGDSHKLKKAVDDAKVVLKMDSYQRLTTVDKLSKDPENIEYMLIALQKVFGAVQTGSLKKKTASKNIIHKRAIVQKSYNSWQKGANAKLLLTDLMLNL